MKISLIDPEISLLQEIIKNKYIKEIKASKIYSPVGKFAQRAK